MSVEKSPLEILNGLFVKIVDLETEMRAQIKKKNSESVYSRMASYQSRGQNE